MPYRIVYQNRAGSTTRCIFRRTKKNAEIMRESLEKNGSIVLRVEQKKPVKLA